MQGTLQAHIQLTFWLSAALSVSGLLLAADGAGDGDNCSRILSASSSFAASSASRLRISSSASCFRLSSLSCDASTPMPPRLGGANQTGAFDLAVIEFTHILSPSTSAVFSLAHKASFTVGFQSVKTTRISSGLFSSSEPHDGSTYLGCLNDVRFLLCNLLRCLFSLQATLLAPLLALRLLRRLLLNRCRLPLLARRFLLRRRARRGSDGAARGTQILARLCSFLISCAREGRTMLSNMERREW